MSVLIQRECKDALSVYVPRPVVLNVILLDLLHMVIALREIHAFGILPREISNETEKRQD